VGLADLGEWISEKVKVKRIKLKVKKKERAEMRELTHKKEQ
jgi:hypothetical protein